MGAAADQNGGAVKRNIEVPEGIDPEGLMYDVDRARREGLHEELRVHVVTGVYGDALGVQANEKGINAEELEMLQSMLDFGVNVEPGQEQTVTIVLKYRYSYGTAEGAPSVTEVA
jgi:hypothetical protein